MLIRNNPEFGKNFHAGEIDLQTQKGMSRVSKTMTGSGYKL